MSHETITVPDLGGAAEVEVIEIAVRPGDSVAAEQTLITLESDKASMELPSPRAGTVHELKVKVGDKVRQGDAILTLQVDDGAGVPAVVPAPAAAPVKAIATAPSPAVDTPAAATLMERRSAARAPAAMSVGPEVVVTVPDLGGAAKVEVIEVTVRAGDRVIEGAPLLVMEGEKASMELPSPATGVIESIEVRVGAHIESGQRIAVIRADTGAMPAALEATAVPDAAPVSVPAVANTPVAEGDAGLAIARVLEKERHLAGAAQRENPHADVTYAGPAVRKLARELGVTLTEVRGSGPRGRVLKDDIHAFVKQRLSAPPPAAAPAGAFALPAMPTIDFATFGPVENVALGNTQKAIVVNMARSWLHVPRVTQFDLADVSDLESFRESLKPEMEKRGNKLTPLPFLLLACARALREFPRFNASLHPDGAQLVLKKYVHLGIAVDTPQGLVVPVIRDADRKSLWELSAEARELADRARARKLKIAEMQGACFTISSLGGIGGEGFTPIVNTPELAILGVSKLAIRPVWDGTKFQPRKTLPLSLSYDHRVINGADAGAFLTFLVGVLADLRRLVL